LQTTQTASESAKEKRLPSRQLAIQAAEAAMGKKGLEPLLLDVSEQSTYTDYILIVSGRSDRHVNSVADGVEEVMKALGRQPIGVEGKRDGKWALLDYGELVVHVFYHPVREHYDLESLWSDAPRVALEVPADNRISASDSYGL
jgi:ribosome-associated protein